MSYHITFSACNQCNICKKTTENMLWNWKSYEIGMSSIILFRVVIMYMIAIKEMIPVLLSTRWKKINIKEIIIEES